MTDAETEIGAGAETGAEMVAAAEHFLEASGEVWTAFKEGDLARLTAALKEHSDAQLQVTFLDLAAGERSFALLTGLVACEIRARTPDGDWGRRVRELAASSGVTDRTIHRWISKAQEKFQLELSPAQVNARALPTGPSEGQGPEHWAEEWDDEGEALSAGFTSNLGHQDGLEGMLAMRESVGEAGWGDGQVPPADYVNAEPPPREERRVVPIDETWAAFTRSQTLGDPRWEHLGELGAERAVKLRWDQATRERPLDLLEELEVIHGDGGVPDELAAALLEAEERRAIKPEVVEGRPKRERKAGGTSKTPEGLMVAVRELHQRIVKTREDGGAAAVVAELGSPEHVANLQGLVHAATGCLNKVRSAVDEVKRTGGARRGTGTQEF